MANEYADIEDINGNVIGQLDLSTMRVLAPNPRVDEAVEKGEPIYMRKKGARIATILTPDKPKSRRSK
ncbi:hypothetical protein EOA33_10755 [Mesorhizobium sp. M4A.F.Ca.ET.050.02.1.1]|uniref:hypothetical protein n=1 Tax=Mesorhizobium sp. M4A.F.Ca.ET.050.02.1.1 TaxID=2496754 RepID=UPI000FCA976E|nr:hypothetical protein [Mesorhizobium sp. M4A.F.Ca.ET.050.02.1.1]RUX50043.1 hypothetical protein EOA33_10755 [Mesorhizobium sp. M4A.F.Ca.ET.050.02.1.1]TIT73196.1 MAG: hypothetical protein E5W60_02810 [Mesorhizobium sp.]